MVKYKKFKIEDVLTWQPQKEIDPLKINELLEKRNKKYPFYGQATVNNGIISYISLTDTVINNKLGKPTILIHSNNQNIVYLETPFYLKDGHGATSVLQSDFLNEKTALYLMACIKKVISKKFSYNEKATKIALKNTLIELPVKSNDEIDYEYMENYIGKVEEDYMKELSAYLKTSGLEKFDLSSVEQVAIDRYRKGDVQFKDFKIVDVFDVQNTHSILKSWITPDSGKTPYVTAGEGNNSISTYITYDEKQIEEGNSIMIGGKTLVVTYQLKDYYSNDSHNLALLIKDEKGKNEEIQLFMVSALYKSLKPLYTWGNSISKKKIQEDKLSLPIDENGDIDFDYMHDFIKAQEKLSVKGIVSWK